MGLGEQTIMLEQELRKLDGKSSVAVLAILGFILIFFMPLIGIILIICAIAQAMNISGQKKSIKSQLLELAGK